MVLTHFYVFCKTAMATVDASEAPLAGGRFLNVCWGRGCSPLPQKDPHQLCQDRQEDDDGGCVAGKLSEEGDDHSDEQHSQGRGHILQGVQLPANPYRQP